MGLISVVLFGNNGIASLIEKFTALFSRKKAGAAEGGSS